MRGIVTRVYALLLGRQVNTHHAQSLPFVDRIINFSTMIGYRGAGYVLIGYLYDVET